MEEKINRQLAEAVQEATGATARLNMDSLGFDGLRDVEVINFRELKKLMPVSAAGMPRTKQIGETTSALGLTFSQAEASYGSERKRIDATLIDSGGAGMLVASMAGFTKLQVDKETENGSERTLTLDGHPAYETYAHRGGRITSNLSVLVSDRFIIQLTGTGVGADALHEVYGDFDIASLVQ